MTQSVGEGSKDSDCQVRAFVSEEITSISTVEAVTYLRSGYRTASTVVSFVIFLRPHVPKSIIMYSWVKCQVGMYFSMSDTTVSISCNTVINDIYSFLSPLFLPLWKALRNKEREGRGYNLTIILHSLTLVSIIPHYYHTLLTCLLWRESAAMVAELRQRDTVNLCESTPWYIPSLIVNHLLFILAYVRIVV